MLVLGWVAAVVLLLVGALHVVWMFSPWPLRTPEEFARKVVGVEVDALPSRTLTALVVVALVAAAYLVAAKAGIVTAIGPDWGVPVGAAGAGIVLLLRGLAGFVQSSRRDTEFARLDLRVYAPLCVALGGACLAVAIG
ncbi:DUF3995 domain-containing protein [Actinokineospora sp. HUAS TT18]|uniref:DUF3995 domain-containing protein n=1 Tax=Actinokineospora sp. HUAS TT18 TaxID=3447451 RepID=UPI003F51E763